MQLKKAKKKRLKQSIFEYYPELYNSNTGKLKC